jgi:hypothetical protein
MRSLSLAGNAGTEEYRTLIDRQEKWHALDERFQGSGIRRKRSMLVPFDGPDGFDPGGEKTFLGFSPAGTRVFVAPKDGQWVVVLDVCAGKQIQRFTNLSRFIGAFFLAEDQLVLCDGGNVKVHEPTAGREVTWEGEKPSGWGVWASADRRWMAQETRAGLSVYDLEMRKHFRTFAPLLPGRHTCVCFSPDSRFLAVDSYCLCRDEDTHRYIQVWEVQQKLLFRLIEVNSGDGDLRGMAFSPDNRLLALSEDWGADLFDLEKGERVGGHDPGPSITGSVRFSPGGHSLELISIQGQMARINLQSGQIQQSVPPPEGLEIWACAVNHKGLVAGVVGKSVAFWQLPEWIES